MLSDRERQELGLIEEGLRDDSRLAASLARRRPPAHLRPGVVRTVITVGLLIAVSGLLLGVAGLFFQGTLLAGASYGWWVWRGKRSAARWTGSTAPDTDPGAIPGRST